jgi:hypothetical protein
MIADFAMHFDVSQTQLNVISRTSIADRINGATTQLTSQYKPHDYLPAQ